MDESREKDPAPIPMVLYCPACGLQHVDKPDAKAGWTNPPHRSHKCAGCPCIWRPADVATTGVIGLQTRGTADTWPLAAQHGPVAWAVVDKGDGELLDVMPFKPDDDDDSIVLIPLYAVEPVGAKP